MAAENDQLLAKTPARLQKWYDIDGDSRSPIHSCSIAKLGSEVDLAGDNVDLLLSSPLTLRETGKALLVYRH
jgi:hypothetical protein